MKPCIASFFAGTAFVACLALANASPALRKPTRHQANLG